MSDFLSFLADEMDTTTFPYVTIFFRIFLSFIAGFILGLERKSRQQQVGLRTLILICVSSTVLMLLSIHLSTLNPTKGDPSRLAAQVVSGIGFLGAGAILRQGLNIKGLTSAAIIWVSAALGLAIGAGLYIIAFSGLAVCIVSLILLEKFETRYFPAERSKHLQLIFHNNKVDFTELHNCVEDHGMIINSMDISKQMNEKTMTITFSVRVPEKIDIVSLTDSIKKIGNLEQINLAE